MYFLSFSATVIASFFSAFNFSTSFFFSVFDVFTDGWSGYTFIFGTDYIKNVASPNDTSVTAYPCRSIGRYIIVAENGTESVEY